jgi:hypothetical protein
MRHAVRQPKGLSGYHPEPAKDLNSFVFGKNQKHLAESRLDGSTLLTVPPFDRLRDAERESKCERSRRERSKRLSMTKVPFSSGLLV